MLGNLQRCVQKAIASSDVVIFSKTGCPFCGRVKELFTKKGKEFKAVEIDKMSNSSEVQDELKNITGARTVPRVFIKGKCYGGCDDLLKLNESGKLDKILSQS